MKYLAPILIAAATLTFAAATDAKPLKLDANQMDKITAGYLFPYTTCYSCITGPKKSQKVLQTQGTQGSTGVHP